MGGDTHNNLLIVNANDILISKKYDFTQSIQELIIRELWISSTSNLHKTLYKDCCFKSRTTKDSILGTLLHFNDLGCNLNDLYFINPSWLCQMMARVVTVKEVNPFISERGVLSKTDCIKLFPDKSSYTAEFFEQYFR